MRRCEKCGKQFEDEMNFCPDCGAEWIRPDKKISFFEKRKAKDRETQEILSKASINVTDIIDIEEGAHDCINFKHLGKLKDRLKKTIIFFSLSILALLVCIIGIVVMKLIKMNETVKTLLILAFFLCGFVSVSYFMTLLYQLRVYKTMCKSSFAIKKINYGKPAQLNIMGNLFEINTCQTCPMCLQTTKMHLEEFQGNFIVVCDTDRSHLLNLNTSALKQLAFSACQKENIILPQNWIEEQNAIAENIANEIKQQLDDNNSAKDNSSDNKVDNASDIESKNGQE